MSDEYDVKNAAARLARLSTYGRTPDPDEQAEARRSLATAKIDRLVRDTARAGVTLDAVQVGHLVGLLIGNAGADYDTTYGIERAAVEAVRAAQGGVA